MIIPKIAIDFVSEDWKINFSFFLLGEKNCFLIFNQFDFHVFFISVQRFMATKTWEEFENFLVITAVMHIVSGCFCGWGNEWKGRSKWSQTSCERNKDVMNNVFFSFFKKMWQLKWFSFVLSWFWMGIYGGVSPKNCRIYCVFIQLHC